MKRILVVITTGFVSYGGLTTVAMNYYRKINMEKYTMDFASVNEVPENLCIELQSNGSKYYKLPNRKNIISYMRQLALISKSYDIVHIHANSATATIELFATRNVPKRIVHIHNTTCKHKFVHKALHPLFVHMYTNAIACSDLAGTWIFKKNEYSIINNAIDIERYSFSEHNRNIIRSKYGLTDEFIIGHVGKINQQKNHLFMIEVFNAFLKSFPNSKLMLVGEGDLRYEVEKKIEELNIKDNVILCGMVLDASIYYSAFDCVLFPSLWEGLPLALIEAQACGLPCIVADTITKEVDMNGCIWQTLENDVDSWVEDIIQAKKKDRKELIKICRDKIVDAGFSVDRNVLELERIYANK